MNVAWLKPAPDSVAARQLAQGKAWVVFALNLVWASWLFGDLIYIPQSVTAQWWIVTLGSLAIFLPLYLAGYLRSVREVGRFATLIGLLGLAVLPVNNSGASTYVIFCCAYMGFVTPTRRAVFGILTMVGIFAICTVLRGWPWILTATMAFIACSVGMGNSVYRLNWIRDAELKLSHEEVRRLAGMAERERIGRDLHDLLGHTLSLITLKLELSRRLFDRDVEAARREVEEAETVARHALAEVRSAVTGIRATGIAAELASAKLLLNASGVHFEYVSELSELPSTIEAPLALVLREAVTNIHRHAHATRAEARVSVVEGELQLCISDNGRGSVGEEGNGLCGMRERVRAMHGSLAVESSRGHGTLVRVRIPLPLAIPAKAAAVPTELPLQLARVGSP
jgi:two-component system sensor histidine kinase DesK